MFKKYPLLIILLGLISSGCIQPQENRLLNHTENHNNGTNNVHFNQTKGVIEPNIIIYESTVDNKSLTIGKAVYYKGEKIEALFKFEGELFVHPYIRIFKFDNDSWVFLGMWNFRGDQYICCGMIPKCSKFYSSESSPLLINWDQKVVEEPNPVLPGKNVTKKQIDSGKYKIGVVYGSQSICTDIIEAEFSIED